MKAVCGEVRMSPYEGDDNTYTFLFTAFSLYNRVLSINASLAPVKINQS